MNILLKKFIGFSIGPVIGSIISFITIPLTTFFVKPDEFGKASMFSLFQSVITTFLYLGLDQSYTREYHETNDKENLFKTSIIIPLLISLLIFIVICFNLNTFSILLFGSSGYNIATLLFGLIIIFTVIERFVLLSIRMKENALEYSIVNIVLKLSVLIFTLFFVLFIRRDFLAVVYSVAFGQIFTDIYLVGKYRKYLNFRNFFFDKVLFIRLLKFGFPLVIAASINNLLHSLDRITLRVWSDFYEIGVFTAALKISSVLLIVQSSFTSFWVPVAYRWYSQNKDIKYYELVSKIVLFAMSFLFCLMLLFKDFIIKLLGNDYADAKFIIALLCLYPVMYTLSETTTLGITFSRKSYYNIWVSLFSIIPNLILNYLLIPSYGAVGAAVGTGVAYIIFFLARSYFSNKNWVGFSLKPHVFLSLFLLVVALINTQDIKNITLINFGFLLVIVVFQITTLKQIINIYRGKDNQVWDFS